MQTESLSLHEARARALAAQGFDRKRGKVDAKAIESVIAATQLLQIDSVSDATTRPFWLRLLADWLGLARVAVGRRGNFAKHLARHLRC